MQRISSTEWIDFNVEWIKGQHKGLRFGQAFLNTFFPQETNPDVFYEEDKVTAIAACYAQYVDPSKSIAHKQSKVDPKLAATIKKNLSEL